jgi:hypothetical protein
LKGNLRTNLRISLKFNCPPILRNSPTIIHPLNIWSINRFFIFMNPLLPSEQRIGESGSNGFYWRRIVVRCGSPDLDSRIDSASHTCFFQGLQLASIYLLWIKVTIETNWIICLFIFIPSLNHNSKHCRNSWIKMFFRLWITFINHIWIKFTLDTNWIENILSIKTSINFDSTQCRNSWIKMFFRL